VENGIIMGIIQAVTNIPIGVLLVIFHTPIGRKMSAAGKKLHFDKIAGEKLYQEKNSKRFILIVGIWLITWGIIALFLFPKLTGNNS
jgi:hypothetical protein